MLLQLNELSYLCELFDQHANSYCDELINANARLQHLLFYIVVRDKLKFTRLLDWLYCNQSKLQPR